MQTIISKNVRPNPIQRKVSGGSGLSFTELYVCQGLNNMDNEK